MIKMKEDDKGYWVQGRSYIDIRKAKLIRKRFSFKKYGKQARQEAANYAEKLEEENGKHKFYFVGLGKCAYCKNFPFIPRGLYINVHIKDRNNKKFQPIIVLSGNIGNESVKSFFVRNVTDFDYSVFKYRFQEACRWLANECGLKTQVDWFDTCPTDSQIDEFINRKIKEIEYEENFFAY